MGATRKGAAVCPITYELADADGGRYSRKGLRLLSRSLTRLCDLPFSAEEQLAEAAARGDKISIPLVRRSFLSDAMKERYLSLVHERSRRLLG